MAILNYGLIGCGMMGHEHIRNIHLLKGCRIAAILEPDAGMRASARAECPDAVFVDTIEQMLDIADLDCLVIASPNYLHAPQLRQITGLRTIPMLVEKPIATEPGDRDFLLELHRTYGAPVWVAMEYRYMPPLTAFLERVEEVTGGVKMLSITEHRFPFLSKVGDWNRFNRYSGGTLVEKCCHFFDLMRLITGAEATRVMGSGGMMTNFLDETYDGETPDIWDAAYALVDFDNGARAMLELCMFAEGSRWQEVISAIGPKGKIECLIPGPTRFWPEDAGPAPTPKLVISPRARGQTHEIEVPVDPALLTAGDHHGSTFYQHQAFRRVLLGEQTVEVTLLDGWKAVEIGMAAQKAGEMAEVVRL